MIPLTRAIPERFRGGYDDALYKSSLPYLLHPRISSSASFGTALALRVTSIS